MAQLYISITTIRKYKPALDMLLLSLPDAWKTKYILVYQDEPVETNNYKQFDDGHIEVYIKNNLSDYGNWIGVHMLIENNVVPKDSWFLFIHDTCKFMGQDSASLTQSIVDKYNDSPNDIVWLCNNGMCNLCLIRRDAITFGNNRYKNIMVMSKMETIKYEWEHKNFLSPKSFPVKKVFLPSQAQRLGKRFVYNTSNQRDVVLYTSINLEKYFYMTKQESDHPRMP